MRDDLTKPVLPKCENKRLIKGNWRRHGSEVVIRWCQRFFSRRFATRLRRSILSPLTRKKPLTPRVQAPVLSHQCSGTKCEHSLRSLTLFTYLLLQLFEDFSFGEYHLDTIHLSTRGSFDADGHYECAASVPLP